jgi:hypothetical protein
MAHLFDPLSIRDLTFANRVFVPPMCEYSSTDGWATDWHFVHLGSRAVGARSRDPVDLKNLESCFQEQHAIPEH